MSGIANAIKKASKDADFRGRLLADPKAALEEIGASVKANTEVVVVENTADRVHLVAATGRGRLLGAVGGRTERGRRGNVGASSRHPRLRLRHRVGSQLRGTTRDVLLGRLNGDTRIRSPEATISATYRSRRGSRQR